jgi:26S proteasome regulatory subunit N8
LVSDVHELMRKYCPEPVLVIIDVNPVDELTIPTEAYRSVENSAQERSENRRTFVHIQSSVGAFEAEEVGVEQLLRDIRVNVVSIVVWMSH